MAYISRSEGIRRGIIVPRGAPGYEQKLEQSRSGTRSYSGGVSAGTVKRTKDGRVLISGGVDKKGRQLWVTEDMGTYLYSYKGAEGNLVLGGFDTSIPAGQKAEKNYLAKLYEKRKASEAAALKKQLAERKTFESQVDLLRGDLDKQFSSAIIGLKGRRWSPRVASGRKAKAQELSTMQKKLAGLSREKWLTEVEELSKEQTTKTKTPRKRRLTRSAYDVKLMSGVGRRLSGRK